MSSESSEKKGKELFAKLGRTLRAGAETLVQETRELTRVGKIKVELLSLENERGRKFEEIGRLAHTLYRGGTGLPSELSGLLEAVDEIEARIDDKNLEAERLRTEEIASPEPQKADEPIVQELDAEPIHNGFCPSCGAQRNADDRFCAKCGNPLR